MTAHREYGTVRWVRTRSDPGPGLWRVLIFRGTRDVKLSDHPTYEAAADALRAYVKSIPR